MKTREEIENMYEFVGYFNEGLFMNKDYRKGIMDALSYVLFSGGNLETIKRHLSNFKSDAPHINDFKKVCLQCGGTGIMGNEEINAACDSCQGTGKPISKL